MSSGKKAFKKELYVIPWKNQTICRSVLRDPEEVKQSRDTRKYKEYVRAHKAAGPNRQPVLDPDSMPLLPCFKHQTYRCPRGSTCKYGHYIIDPTVPPVGRKKTVVLRKFVSRSSV